MNYLVITICSLFILFSCHDARKNEKMVTKNAKDKYELITLDSYSFRRAYHGHELLEGMELKLVLNRNPEPDEAYLNSKNHPLYNDLTRMGLIKDGNLNISEVDTLPKQFSYKISPNQFFTVKTNLLQDPTKVKTPSYELTFMNKGKSILIDTLAFDWPPDVTFFKADIDNDGTDELLSIFKWYIINGDNFDLKIYKLKTPLR